MAEVKLTEYQRAVVENSGGTLLISAAAGSGKTHVLIERMLKRVCSPVDPCNIDDFLMITFTKAAAAELRGKIIRRLNETMAQSETTPHLQEQLNRVYLAQISTIHGFCSTLLRDYAHQLDLPADFRIMEDTETDAMCHRVMQKLLSDVYVEKDPDIFATLDTLGAGRDDSSLPEMIFRCYDAVVNTPDQQHTLATLREMLVFHHNEALSESRWGRYLISEFHYYISEARSQLFKALELIRTNDWLEKYTPAFESLDQLLLEYSQAETWDDIHNIPLQFQNLARITKSPEPDIKAHVKTIRDSIKKKLSKWLTRFSLPSDDVIEDLCRTAPALRGLLSLTERFSERYRKEKHNKHALDYNDLEQETLRLLYGSGDQPTAAAKEISQRYVELMIDEYQDTNAVQDKIFAAISKNGENLFFVGDVKQSIYRFRRAEPKIFTSKYYSYADYQKAKEKEPRRILLSDNFRSSAAILSAANDVFRLCMNKRVGDVDYGDEEALRAKAQIPALEIPAVELHCIDFLDEYGGPELNKEHYEAEFVARRIAEIVKNETIPGKDGPRKTEPEDIVILLRSLSGKAVVFQNALQRYGFSSVCSSENLFEAEEIQFLHNLLRIIDNPHQDIPLLSVLLSAVVRFSPDQLAFVRAHHRDQDIYESLSNYAPETPFLHTLSALRQAAQQGSIRELINQIEDALPIRSVYRLTQYNLDAFASVVDRFESGTQFGLPAFLRYLERVKEKGLQSDDSKRKGFIQITTIHKSKGLEYPIVLLCDLCKPFNNRDATRSLQIDEEFGVAAKVFDQNRLVNYPTAALNAIAHKIKRENMSEEMRILYVAMTRPQHRLIMTCCNKKLSDKITDLAQEVSVPMAASTIEAANSHGDWILMTALTHSESGALYREDIPCRDHSPYPWLMRLHQCGDYKPSPEPCVSVTEQETVPPLQTIDYVYQKATVQEGKLTATQLKGRNLDEELSPTEISPVPRFVKPNFKEKRLSPAEKGTAIHLAMQYLKYENCTTESGVKAELGRLVSQRFISQEQASAVPAETILHFFRSDLGKRVLTAPKVIREFKFSVLEDAGKFDPSLKGESLLLQGVTDCCLIENGMLTILDFKSDHITKGQERERAEYYRGQLDAYGDALSRIFKLPVKDKILYFFSIHSAFYLTE